MRGKRSFIPVLRSHASGDMAGGSSAGPFPHLSSIRIAETGQSRCNCLLRCIWCLSRLALWESTDLEKALGSSSRCMHYAGGCPSTTFWHPDCQTLPVGPCGQQARLQTPASAVVTILRACSKKKAFQRQKYPRHQSYQRQLWPRLSKP